MSTQLFFVLERFRRRFAQILVSLRPLSIAKERPRTHSARVFFREQTGVALLELNYTAPLRPTELEWTMARARRAGVPVLDPQRLGEEDRERFFSEYLDGYETCTDSFPAGEPALLALGDEMGLTTALAPQGRTASGSTGGDILLARARMAGDLAGAARSGTEADPARSGAVTRIVASPAAARRATAAQSPISRRRQMAQQARDSAEATTASGAAAAGPRQKRPTTMAMGSPMRTVRATPVNGTFAEDPGEREEHIEVRFLRGDTWATGRLRALNAKGLFVATSAPPRLRDLVHVALRFRDTHVVVRGAVTRVVSATDPSPDDPAMVGFRAAFIHLDDAPRRQLVALLRAAHAAGVSLVPPPERAAIRFPVHWPIRLSTKSGHVTAPALDVSTSGLFVGVEETLVGELRFLLPMDNGESPIRGRARVARKVDPDMARRRGLASGYGVHIVELGNEDQRRYQSFLGRIRDRSARRVVVVAGPERAKVVTRALSGAGYAVSCGSDPGVLLRRWELEPRPPDLAVFDSSLEGGGKAANQLRRRWAERGVVCINSSADKPEQIRATVDRLLKVGRRARELDQLR